MKYMANILSSLEIFDDVVQVTMIAIRGVSAFCASEGYSCHKVGSALGEVKEDAQESEVL